MRVVRIVTRLNRGGPLRQLCALVPGLAREGIGGPVLVGEAPHGEEDASGDLRALGVAVERVPGLVRGVSPRDDAAAWRALRRRLRALRPDVVHTHLGKAGALGRLAAAAVGVPAVVHTFHGHHLHQGGALALGTRLAERALARLGAATAPDGAARVIALSARQRDDLVAAGVVPPDRVEVIGPGLDLEALRAAVDPASVAALRARLSPDGAPVTLWLGRFVPAKDPLALVAVASWLPREAGRLVLAGDGPLRGAVARAVAVRGLHDRVRLLGPRADVAALLGASDALCLPSRSEGTPLCLIEAMALGVPVVATAVGGVPDLVEHDATGVLVAPGCPQAFAWALAALLADPGRRARLAVAARAWADRHADARHLVSATASLYGRMLGRRPSAPAV